MKSSIKSRPKLQTVSSLPLFDWWPLVRRPETSAGLYLMRYYRIHPSIADAIAALAGLGSAVER